MGVLATGSAYDRPSAQPPIDISGNILVNLKIFLSNFLAISGNSNTNSLIAKKILDEESVKLGAMGRDHIQKHKRQVKEKKKINSLEKLIAENNLKGARPK